MGLPNFACNANPTGEFSYVLVAMFPMSVVSGAKVSSSMRTTTSIAVFDT